MGQDVSADKLTLEPGFSIVRNIRLLLGMQLFESFDRDYNENDKAFQFRNYFTYFLFAPHSKPMLCRYLSL